MKGCSSVDRAPVSKTGCPRFESLYPCHTNSLVLNEAIFFVDKNNLMVYHSFRKFNQLVRKIARKGNGVETGAELKNKVLGGLDS